MRKTKKKAQELEQREKELRIQLEKSEVKLRNSAKRIGLFALISGLIALLFYWIYKMFLSSNTSKEVETTEKKPTRKISNINRIGSFITPYLTELLRKILELEKEEKPKSE